MKIALNAKHWGLIDLMYGVLRNHDVRLQEPFDGHMVHQGDEDLIISTFAYTDLPDYKGDKPLIIYATDPVPLFILDKFREVQKQKNVTIVISERCYPQEVQPILKSYTEIPFAIDANRYFPYTGEINKVLIANRKPHDRWDEIIKGVTGLGCPLSEYLEGIPFDIAAIQSNAEYRETIGKYKVMFYFSNSPYTIVMFEGMTLGIPMVGFNHFNISSSSPVEKYLHNYSTDKDEIRRMLKLELDKPVKKESYNIIGMDDAVSRWDKLIKEICMK